MTNSINNNGVPYYFPADIAKEGGQYVRISNFFKTRVGDNGKVLPFKWYDQGRVMNVHGFIPFIRGLIGKFSTDDNGEVIMAPDASYREWQGSTANAHDGGFIDYILEDQMFPQEGIFKGHFGLKDGNGNVLTSVNIIFEVLGNDLRVGETVKYYVGELENLKNQYKIDGEQAIDDLYQKYQNDVVQVQNALHTNNASLDALSTTVKGLNANIQANNVVTRPEFDRLSNEIVTRLSQMNTTPDYYENYNSMIAANPNGTQNLCVTSDNQHKWLYINSKWVDLGDFSYAGIAPQLKQDLYSGDHDNALINPDLKNDAYNWTRDSKWDVDPAHTIGNSLAYGCLVQNAAKDENHSFFQKDIFVAKRSVLSCGVKVNTKGLNQGALQLLFRDASNEVIDSAVFKVQLPADTYADYKQIKLENIAIPANAETAAFSVAMQGTGVLVICRPQMNFGSSLLPYSLNDVVNKNDTFGNLPYFNFGISKDTVGEKWVKAPFTYHRESTTIRGFAQIAIQGDSSRAYPKKNYKIKLFSDEDCQTKFKIRLKLNWAKTNKFNLKANWIDASQSRNLVNASLMANATSVTEFAKSEVEDKLSYTQSYGQMEGFPGLVQFNGMSNGLYSFNTKKDDIIFGMDGIEKTAAIAVLDNEKAPASQRLVVPSAKLDNVAYADELHDTPDPELVTNWSKWLDFLNNSTDDDFKTKVSNYIDLNAAINIYLFGVMSREYDYYSKSILFLTWDNGNYFYPIAYDLDSTWGQNVTGAIEGNPQDENWGFSTERSDSADGKYVSNAGWNKLFERLYKLFKPEIKRQYQHLRSTVWRTDQILNQFKNYMSEIPEEAIEYDHELWNIPSADTNNYEQLHHVITQRSNQMDRWINHLEE